MLLSIDNKGKLVRHAFVILIYEPNLRRDRIFGQLVDRKGYKLSPFWTSEERLLSKQLDLNFKIINRSGQCLSFLGDNI